ncbi:hypothetical protein [Ranid herpesvirus 3]|uniref:Uncharacterized protein n=1 Tax=Ranid herpesvirus 3 TaxID=1987509 RepID=A0A1X9T5D1_9VIRU|nr:hypothetical protein [Ranid herpesvirus 3]ARR28909.1 hypothetical protein [Ranid herpesvirus 3]
MMKFVERGLESLALGGSLLFSWLFEHPDYQIYRLMASEETHHAKILTTLNQSVNELRAVNQNMAGPEYYSILETCEKINLEAFDAQKKVDICVKHINNKPDAATHDKHVREATLYLLKELKAKRMFNDIVEHIKIHNNLEVNKQRFENHVHTQITLLSQSQLRVGQTVQQLNTFLNRQAKLLEKTSNMKEEFGTFSKITDYINNDFDYSALTPGTASPYDVSNMLTQRIAKADSESTQTNKKQIRKEQIPL